MIVSPNSAEAYRLLHDGVLALSRAEQQGMCVNLDYIQEKQRELVNKKKRLEEEFKQTVFFKEWQRSTSKPVNINSMPQLSTFLYDVKKLKPVKLTPTEKGSTNEDSLKQLGIPELGYYEEKTRIKKSQDVLAGFEREQVDGVIHPVFNLHLVRTFRSSSDSPNMQNVPVRDEIMMQDCRGALFPRPGHQLLEIDFKSIEVAINACINKDPTLIKYVSDPTTDMHRDMAMQLFLLDKFKPTEDYATLRQAAKNGFVFPEFYGDYYKNCAVNLACNWGKLPQGKWKAGQGIPFGKGTLADHFLDNDIRSLNIFASHVQYIEKDFWENRFKVYAKWKKLHWAKYQKKGFIDLPTGFRCGGIMNKKEVNNYPGQGSAFHCLLWSFIRADWQMRKEDWDTRLISQVHDSMILDVLPEELDYTISSINKITCEDLPSAWKWITVPLNVDMKLGGIDESWAKIKKYKSPKSN